MVARNRTIREAIDFTNRTVAAEFLKKRLSDALGAKIVLSRNVRHDDLRDLIITDYANNGRNGLGDLKTTRLPRLDAVFVEPRRSTSRPRRSSGTRLSV